MRRFDQITTGKNKAPVRIRVVFSLEELNMHITVGDHADQRNVRRSIAKAVRNSSRTWNCLLVAIVLLNVLTWIWFPMTMAIWTASSFIATGAYVWLRTPGRYRVMVRSYSIIPFRDE